MFVTPLSLCFAGFVAPAQLAHFSRPRRVGRCQTNVVAHYDASAHETAVTQPYCQSRRSFLFSAVAFAAGVTFPSLSTNAQSTEAVFFRLPDLPYAYNALEPKISEQIMRAHHDAHFAAYVKKLNMGLNALPDRLRPKPSDDASLRRLLGHLQDIEDTSVRSMVRNNGGGYLNHKQFFSQMSPKARGLPDGALANRIKQDFGSFEKFKEEFITAANTLFGSGFVWLVQDAGTGKLRITKYANQDNPAMDGDGSISLLGCDCWEHAWYYQYGPKKADYINAWWEVVDWPSVSGIYRA